MAYNSHGHTPAAWTTVIIVFLAFVFGSIAVLIQNWPLFWIGGVGVLIVGGIVGKVMQMMGLGQGENPALAAQRFGEADVDSEGLTVREGMAAPGATPEPHTLEPQNLEPDNSEPRDATPEPGATAKPAEEATG